MKENSDKINIIVGKRLKELRELKNLTQAQLAADVNIEISQISRIERGVINTSIGSLFSILIALDLSLKDFFSEGFEKI